MNHNGNHYACLTSFRELKQKKRSIITFMIILEREFSSIKPNATLTYKLCVYIYIEMYSLYSQAINFDSPRGGISLVTEKGPVTSSRLLIQKAILKDSGLYTCAPSNAHPNSVRVHILNGKKF